MKVLQICLRVPFPPKDGGTIAINRLTTGLEQNKVSVHIAAVNTEKHFVNVNLIPLEIKEKNNLLVFDIDSRVKAIRAVINLFFSDDSYNVIRFYNKEFESLLIEQITKVKYDFIILESIFMGMYLPEIRKHFSGKVWLRSHNIENQIWQQLTSSCKNYFKKKYLQILTNRLKIFEEKLFNEIDGIISISNTDTAELIKLKLSCPIYTLPTGVDQFSEAETTNFKEHQLYHLGSMDWLPNVEGMLWFTKNVWPSIIKSYPKAHLSLAGRKMPDSILKLNNKNNIEVCAAIEDVELYELNKQIMIVPLFSGSGIRIKIIEGLAKGKVIITTSIGAQGIPYNNGHDILIADTINDMASIILKCFSDKIFCNFISGNALVLAKENFDNTVLTKGLINFWNKETI